MTTARPSRWRWLHRAEDLAIAAFVLALVLLAGAQIVLRNVFDTGLAWADPMLRALVLWTAMLGAIAAAREDKHIGLDLLTRFVPPAAARGARVAALLFAAAVAATVAWYGIDLVKLDLGGEGKAFGAIPSWIVELIVPVGFALLALRLAVHAFLPPHGTAPALAPELP